MARAIKPTPQRFEDSEYGQYQTSGRRWHGSIAAGSMRPLRNRFRIRAMRTLFVRQVIEVIQESI
jgi:hypothetical protein